MLPGDLASPMRTSGSRRTGHGFLSSTGSDLGQLLGRPFTDPVAVAAASAAGNRPAEAAAHEEPQEAEVF